MSKVLVYIIESEAGWGSKVDETLEFDTQEEAENYVKEYNNKYNPPRAVTPSWYMFARLAKDDSFGMAR